MPINPYEKYQEQAVFTMTPGELIILLYEKAISNMSIAMLHMNNQKPDKARTYIIKAQNIVLYLRKILDMKYPVAKTLFDCYTFVHKKLIMVNVKKDRELLEELITMMKELKVAWDEIEAGNREKALKDLNT